MLNIRHKFFILTQLLYVDCCTLGYLLAEKWQKRKGVLYGRGGKIGSVAFDPSVLSSWELVEGRENADLGWKLNPLFAFATVTKRHWQFLSVGLGWKSLNTPLLWAPRCSANNHHHLQHDQHEYEHLNFICVVLSLEACNRGNVCNRGNGQIMRSLPSFYWSRSSLEPASPTYPCLASSVSSRSPLGSCLCQPLRLCRSDGGDTTDVRRTLSYVR